MNKFKIINLFLIVVLAGCEPKPISIVALKGWGRMDSVQLKGNKKILLNNTIYFLMRNYDDNKESLAYLDTFIIKRIPRDLQNFTNYNMTFYKESNETNEKTIGLTPNVIDPVSEQRDLVFVYWWYNGDFISRTEYKNGKAIDSNTEIKLSPPPPN